MRMGREMRHAGYIPTGGADDAGKVGSGPWQAVLPGGAGSRSAGAPRRRNRRRSGGAVCGANPGLSSAAARAPFATPSDRWWPALYESGFTPRRLGPHEAHELLALRLGLTSLVRRPTVGVAELAKAEFVAGGQLLRRRVLARRPRWLAVLGVTAYRAAFGRPDAAVGLQEDTIGSTRLWILPNPSGLNAHYPPRALATEFARLRVAAGLPDRSRRLEDATLCRRKGRTGRDGLAGERFRCRTHRIWW
jgi:TDG/mug DNA glycosylase family protein